MSRPYLVAGNWKMNGTLEGNTRLLQGILVGLERCPDVEILVCPPAVYLESTGASLKRSRAVLGAQNLCEQDKPGAFTGEIHGHMLKELGCRYVIVGHSERRTLYGETDDIVARKFRAAQICGLTPIFCVGETLQEREMHQTESVLGRQLGAVLKLCGIHSLAQAVLAYEPVWAIGTGRTATPEQAQKAHAFLRAQVAARDARIAAALRVLYGGSVKMDNASALFSQPDVDGGLIGGASLKADEFLGICGAAQAQMKAV
ncbi:MAG: triose-phosphate isomerase [Nevskiales bacterium]|nr:triose-phosphate isomerase [Nevskiales bacterium]